MSLVLYRKYRPQLFSEVVGQDHIIDTLRGGIMRSKISHAYIFTGPRGTGKTTVARILAKALNCEDVKKGEPCNKCGPCRAIINNEVLDIMEVDAASNRGIDEIRELRESIRFTPSVLKYKVFIIDEVHMLTKEAFNAVLKTLEEPPSHAIFILATTEAHKVLPTILSRCQRFSFRRLKLDELIKRLKGIADSEKIKVSDSALRFIALSADGCMRDAESLLGQIIALGDKKIDLSDIQSILGIADVTAVFDFFDSLFAAKYGEIFSLINGLVDQGADMQHFLRDVVDHARKLIFIHVHGGHFSAGFNNSFWRGIEEWTEDQKGRALTQIQNKNINDLISALNIFVKSLDDLRKFPLPQMALEMAALETMQMLPAVNNSPSTASGQQQTASSQVISSPVQQGERARRIGGRLAEDNNKSNEAIKLKNKKTPIADPPVSGSSRSKAEKQKIDKIADEKQRQHISVLTIGDIKDHWNDILKEVKPHNNSLFAFLDASLPQRLEGNILIVASKYNFHKERLEAVKNRLVVEEALEKVFKEKLRLKCVLDQSLSFPQRISEGAKDLVSSALKIFGGKMVE